jgi:signal transduction histidine kinase/ligand-binding sensor domain-containing protein
LLLLVSGLCTLYAQPELGPFHTLGVKEGLSNSSVAFMYRDSRGFMWLSSIDGLNRFDGREVRKFRSNAAVSGSLVGNNVQSAFLEAAGSGDIWFSTWEAINCYRRATDDFAHFQLKDAGGKPMSAGYHLVHREKNGWLWIQIEDEAIDEGGKLYRFNPATDQQIELGRIGGSRFKVDTAANGDVLRVLGWHLTGKAGLEVLSPNGSATWKRAVYLEKTISPNEAFFVFSCAIVSEGNYWLATQTGLVHFAINTGKTALYRPEEQAKVSTFSDIAVYDKKYLIIATRGSGLYIFDRDLRIFVKQFLPSEKQANGLVDLRNDNLYIDQQRTIWVSQWTNGVQYAHLDKRRVINLQVDTSALTAKAFFLQSLVVDGQGKVWAASDRIGVFRFDPVTKIKSKIPFPETIITRLGADLSGNVWAFNNKSIYRFNPSMKLFEQIKMTESDFTGKYRCLLQRKNGTILIGTYNGLFELTQQAGLYHLSRVAMEGITSVEHLYEDSLGHLWIDANYGTLQCWEDLKLLGSFDINESNAFCEIPESQLLYIATNQGLAIINTKSLTYRLLDESKGLPNSSLMGIAVDKNKQIWLASSHGIIRYNPATGQFGRLTLFDGVWADEFYPDATVQLKNGEIWMANKQVINVFNPNAVAKKPAPTQVQITGIHINDSAKPLRGAVGEWPSLQLPYDSSTLTIDFAALDFSDPKSTQFRYILSGYDPDTLQILPGEVARARYARLPAGDYVFKVWAANADGDWNLEPRQIHISMLPAWYQTWWFTLWVLCTFVSIVWWLVNQRTQRLLEKQRLALEKQQALMLERQRIARDMHDDLGSGLSALQIMSRLTQNKTDDPYLQAIMDKIANSSEQLNQNIREIIWTMQADDETLNGLVYFLRRYCSDFEEITMLDIRVTAEVDIKDRPLTNEQRRNLFLCIKETLNNTIKYAKATAINLHIETNDNQLIVTICDNGVGFDIQSAQDRGGNGLKNIASRMADIGGQAIFESGPGKTCVRLVLDN